MLQKVVDFGRHLFSVMQELQKHEDDIKEIRRDIHQMRQEMNELTRVVERLAFEIRKDQENAARDREIQRLRLENILLRYERGLPPGNNPQSQDGP